MEQPFKVPIRNLFVMLSYANDMPDMVEELADLDEDIITYEFLAKKFMEEARYLIRHRQVRNYVAHTKETGFISGRMLMNESLGLIMEKKPAVVCEKDEYSENVLFNQIMKTTLRDLVRNAQITADMRKACYLLWEQMPAVDEIYLSKEIFMRITYYRHNVHYKRMIHLAHLLHELRLLSHRSGDWSLYASSVQEGELNHFFEKFLLNFYRMEQNRYQVKSEKFHWQLSGDNTFLPSMQTDVSMTHLNESKKIIIDAKFYKSMFQFHFEKQSYHSGNMYQMFTYLLHQPKELVQLRGILIYPFNGQEINEIYRWDERMTIEMMTVDLGASWRDIYRRLLQVVDKQ